MQSKYQGAKFAWGKPTIKIGDTELKPPTEFTPLLIEENDIDDGDNIPFWVDNHEYNVSFDVKLDKASFKSIRRMFVYRMPRKKKKEFKKAVARYHGCDIRDIKVSKYWGDYIAKQYVTGI